MKSFRNQLLFWIAVCAAGFMVGENTWAVNCQGPRNCPPSTGTQCHVIGVSTSPIGSCTPSGPCDSGLGSNDTQYTCPAAGTATPPNAPPGPGGAPPTTITQNAQAQANTTTATPPPLRLNRTDYYDYRGNTTSSDQCRVSATIDPKYGCTGTYTMIQAAQMSNMMTQSAGSITAQTMGAQAQMSALQQGTQSAAMEAAAATQKRTGLIQMTTGGLNTLLGTGIVARGYKHTRDGTAIAGDTQTNSSVNALKMTDVNTGNTDATDRLSEGSAGYVAARTAGGISDKAIRNFSMNENSGIQYNEVNRALASNAQTKAEYDNQVRQREHEGMANRRQVASQLRQVGNAADSEQKTAASAATAGGMMSMMTGAQQMMSGTFSLIAAAQLEATAKKMKNTVTGGVGNIVAPGLPGDLSGGAQTAGGQTSITGDGAAAAASGDSSDAPADSGNLPPSLGDGFNPAGLPSGTPEGPGAGKFTADPKSGAAPGGVGSVDGGGNTSAASEKAEDNQAKLAQTPAGDRYSSGGAFSGGGGGFGKGAEGGPDLSSLLDKFLPKKDDAAVTGNGSIEFAGQNGNHPETAMSVLDKNTDMFARIHDTYQDKARQGFVGNFKF